MNKIKQLTLPGAIFARLAAWALLLCLTLFAGLAGAHTSRAAEEGNLVSAESEASSYTGSLSPITPERGKSQPANRLLVVIDAGHGGIDPGAISRNGTKEKDVVLAFAKSLQKALQARGDVEAVLTRDKDAFLSLQQRVDIARNRQADLMIAIHADTLRDSSVHGTTFYLVSDQASDAEAEALAHKENEADAIAGIALDTQNANVADVLVNLAQRESKNHATMFAETAISRLASTTKFTGKPLRAAGFVVLKAPDVPSVLVELGYLSNADDEKKMKDMKWRDQLAGALADSIRSHFERVSTRTAQAKP